VLGEVVDFRILGPLQVSDDGHDVAIRGEKFRALLGLLLVNANKAVSEDALIDALWGDTASPRAADNLHVLVSRLRRPLGNDRIVRDGHGYRVCVADGELDLDRFLQLRSDGKLGEALKLWRGPPLADFAYASWAASDIRRLEELRLVALEERIELDLAEGRHAELIGELNTLIEQEPLRENLRRLLIIALYRSGRQAEALEAYRAARQMLDEELGLEPGTELQELELAVLRHDPALDAPRRLVVLPKLSLRVSRRRRNVGMALGGALLAFAASAALIVLLAPDEPQPVAAARTKSTVPTRTSPTRRAARPRPKPHTVAAQTRTRLAPRPRAHAKPAPGPSPPPAPPPAPSPAPPAPPPPPKTSTTVPTKAKTVQSRARVRRRTSPIRPAAPPPKPVRISDDFNDGVMNRLIWHQIVNGTGVELAERNGRLEIALQPDALGSGDYNLMGAHYGTSCRFLGNFDARVDYEVLEWPPTNGVAVQLNLWFTSATSFSILRESKAIEQYTTWHQPNGHSTPTTDARGSLRIRRVGNTVSMLYKANGRWTSLGAGWSNGAPMISLQAMATDESFGDKPVLIAFDNFVITAAQPAC
jgi:DNA-binding SARP family transcriptional activator